MCVNRDCGSCRVVTPANTRRAGHGVEAVALCGIAVVILGHLGGLITGLLVTFVILGAVTVTGAAGWVWWRFIRPRQLAQRAAIMAAVSGAAVARQHGGQLGGQAPYAGQLPAGDRPPVQVVINLTDEQAAQFLGRGGGA